MLKIFFSFFILLGLCKAEIPAQLDVRGRLADKQSQQTQSFARLTLTPGKWVFDAIPSRTGREIAGRFGAGYLLAKKCGIKLYLSPSLSANSHRVTLGQGLQIFGEWKLPKKFKAAIAAPINEAYQSPAKSGFKHNHQLVMRHGALGLGYELFADKPFGKKVSGYFGPTASIGTGGIRFEAGLLRDTATSHLMVRFRTVVDFSFK